MKIRLALSFILSLFIFSDVGTIFAADQAGAKHSRSTTRKSRNLPSGEIITGSLMEPFNDISTDIEFVPVPGGCFKMGDTFSEGYFFEKPVHESCINDFFIGKYEVTQIEWKNVMGNNPSTFKNCGDYCPVESVSWDDVQKFIKKLNKKSGMKYRLPTESEWEYAARSGGKEERYSGSSSDPDSYGWHKGNSGEKPHPVGFKKPNGLDIYDMSGNVWEWVLDRFGNYSPHKVYNTMGPKEGEHRIFRGGGWFHPEGNMRTSARFYNVPDSKFDFVGFRLALSIKDFKKKKISDGK